MALMAYRGRQFDHTHENKAFNRLYDALSAHCLSTDQEWHLLANFYVGSRELDALLIKSNALIVVDFKDYGGILQFSEHRPWMMQVEGGNCVEVKGGASVNPLRQLTLNKNAMIDFLGRNLAELNATCNWRHTAAMVAFQGTIEFDASQLPGGIKPWFHISDSREVVRDLDAIVSKQISLSADNIARIVSQLGIEPYIPAGGPDTRPVGGSSVAPLLAESLTTPQAKVLQELRHWLQRGTGMFRVGGMASTGKRFLFPHLVEAIKTAGKGVLLLTPSARLSSNYNHPLVQATSIYTWLYQRESTRFEKLNDRKIGIHDIREGLLSPGMIPVLVDAHLMSDEEFDISDRRYGSGRLLQDFLSVVKAGKASFMVIGDPYQMPRGSLQRSLMTDSLLEQHQIAVAGSLLTEQIVADQDDALSRFQAHLVNRLDSKRFNRLPRSTGKRLQVLDTNSTAQWVPDFHNVRAESTLLCAKHEQTAKINAAVKTRILGHASPVRLAVGDRIDFYNRTPIFAIETDEASSGDLRWISAGEIALVDAVDEAMETHVVELRGRSQPIRLHFQNARCRLSGLGEVSFRYLVDYFEAERPQLSPDQILAMQVLAQKLAMPLLANFRAKLPDKKDPAYQEAKATFDRVEYQTLQAQGYASAAMIRPAHAMTLHRAQGRRWPSVWVNASRSASSNKADNADYFRWLYTASTIADELLIVRQMPELSPLSHASVSRAHDLNIGPFPVRTGLFYDPVRQPTEQEASVALPTGFGDLAFLPLFLTLRERLDNSAWHIEEWREFPYQLVITLMNSTKLTELSAKLSYNKKLAVTTMTYTNGEVADQAAIDTLLRPPFQAQSQALQDALEAITENIAIHGFNIAEASETNHSLKLVVAAADDAVLALVSADKEGRVSSVRISKASSEEVIERFIHAMEITA